MPETVWRIPPRAQWLAVLFVGVVLLTTYFEALREMWETWEDPEYNHGYAIPLISLYLLWIRAADLHKIKASGSWFGLVVIGLALVGYVAGDLSSIFVISQYSFLLMLWGLALTIAGWRGTLTLWAGLAYLVFMIPLPVFVQNALTADLQLVSSQLGTQILRLFGVTVHLQGNVIDLGDYKLQVVEACSGLRYLFPLMSLGFLFAYLFNGAAWQRAVVFLSAVPITVFMNSFRIAVIGLLVNSYGTGAADGFLHFFEGWVVFMACIAILLFEMWLFGRLKSNRGKELFAVEVPPVEDLTSLMRMKKVSGAGLAAGILLLCGAVLGGVLADREETIPARAPLSEFPMFVADWVGKAGSISEAELGVLKLTDYLINTYQRSRQDMPVELYVAYYDSQRQGSSAHSPRSCIPGSGWQITDFRQVELDGMLADGSGLPVNRAVISMGDNNLLVYYLFMQRGRLITNEYLVKWYIFWDSLTKNRTDGALVRVMTPVRDPARIEEADDRLREFLQVVEPRLSYFIPQDEVVTALAAR